MKPEDINLEILLNFLLKNKRFPSSLFIMNTFGIDAKSAIAIKEILLQSKPKLVYYSVKGSV